MSEDAVDVAEWAGRPGQHVLNELIAATNPAVYFPNQIGDAILTLPTVRALANILSAPITLISSRKSFGLCFHEVSNRHIDITGLSDFEGPPPYRTFDHNKLAEQLGPVDLFINTVPWELWWDRFGKPFRRRVAPTTSVGFPYEDDVYDIVIPRGELHAADETFRLAQLFDPSARIEQHAQPVRVAPKVQQKAQDMRAALPDGTKVLVVHTDSSRPEKRWPVTRFVDLLDRFLSRHRDYVAWVVGMGFEELNVGFESDRVIPFLGLRLDLSVELVGSADLFLGVDSCMLHAADLARVPGVGLFCRKRSPTWGFRFGPHRHIDRAEIADIAVEEVLTALEDLAEEHV